MTRRTLPGYLLLCVMSLCASPPLLATINTAVFNGAATPLNLSGTSLNAPAGVAVDSSGDAYISDTGNNRIVKVAPDGTAAALTISGLSTALSSPLGISTDAAGNLYIADSANSRIVMVTPSGTGSVLSMGSVTLSAPQGVAVDPSGNIYVADTGNSRIVKVAAGGAAAVFSITGLGTALNGPAGVAVDTSGNLYIADTGNNRIVTTTSGGAATVLSFGSLTLSSPRSVAVDGFQTLYVADRDNNRVISSATNQALNTVAITLSSPTGVTVDAFGSVYVADTGNNEVAVLGVTAVDFGKLAPGGSTGNVRTLSFTVTGSLSSVASPTMGTPGLDFGIVSGGGTTCTSSTTNATCTVQLQFNPRAAGISRGSVVLVGSSSNVLATVPLYGLGLAPTVIITPATASVLTTPASTINDPFQLAIDGAGNKYIGNYVQNSGFPKVVKLSADGSTASVVSTGSVTLGTSITGVILDGAGTLYIADYYQGRIVQVTAAGIATALSITAGGNPLGQPAQLAMDAGGNLIIADYSRSRIVKVSTASLRSGATSLTGVVVPTPGQTLTPGTVTGVAVDGFGNIYIANRHIVIKATPAGTAANLPTPGVTLTSPQGVTVDGGGNVYIVDVGRIIRVSTAGTASVVQFAGLPSPATISSITFGVTVDAAGVLIIPDFSNNRLVKLDTTNPTPLVFASTPVGQTSSDSPKTLTVQNVGNVALTFPAPSSGTNPVIPASFALNNTSTCPQTSSASAAGLLSPAASCTLAVSFTPAAGGAITGSAVLTDNTANASGPGYATQTVALSGTASRSASTITWNAPAAITYGAALDSTQLDATANVPGTFSYSPAAGTVLPAGTDTLSATFVPADSAGYSNATATTTLTVGKLTTAVTVSAADLAGGSVAITAIVSSAHGTPGGTVAFSSGNTVLGTAPVDSSGKATITLASLPSDNVSVTATYSGDSNYVASTVSKSVTTEPGYTLSASETAITIHIGQSADVALTFAPTGGLTGEVALSCQGLPASMSCAFDPKAFLADGSNTVQTGNLHIVAPGASSVSTTDLKGLRFAGLLITPGLFLGALLSWRRHRPGKGLRRVMMSVVIATLGATVGCDSNHYARTPATATVTVAAAAANPAGGSQGQITQNVSLTITVVP